MIASKMTRITKLVEYYWNNRQAVSYQAPVCISTTIALIQQIGPPSARILELERIGERNCRKEIEEDSEAARPKLRERSVRFLEDITNHRAAVEEIPYANGLVWLLRCMFYADAEWNIRVLRCSTAVISASTRETNWLAISATCSDSRSTLCGGDVQFCIEKGMFVRTHG